jgi:ABC-type uncharacterized transport system involved in gliding motility auxiliary subunit
MKNIKKNLNYIGLTLIFLALLSWRIWPHWKTLPPVLAILGILSLGVYIFLNLSQLKQGLKRKSFIYSSNLLLLVTLVLGILIIVNYFLARQHHRFDFTNAKIHSLSDQSVTVLKALKDEVRVKGFFREGNFNRSKMESLMEIYSYHSPRFKYELIDPDKNPGLVKAYEVTQDGTSILESGEKDSRITSVSEEDITNAVIQVTRDKKKILYFLEGHGEQSIENAEDRGYSLAKDALAKLGYEIKKLSLALADNFPADLSCLIIPGPEKDLLPNEMETIRDYLNTGGRALFMIDPQTAPGMSPFLQEFGIVLADDIVIDTVSRLLGGDYFMPVVNEYEDHKITEKFRYATFFPYARSVEAAETPPEGVIPTVFAKSSGNSWSERQLTEQEVTFNPDLDKGGPVSLAAVVTISPKAKEETGDTSAEPEPAEPEEEDKPEAEGRMAIFGDSDFISNSYYNLSGNGNLFLNTVNWLTEEEDLISIQPKTQSPRTIQLTPSQGRLLFFVCVLILPLAVLVAGLSVWISRRRL